MSLEFWQLGVLEDPGPLLLVTLSSSLTLSGLCNKEDSAARATQGKKEMGLFFSLPAHPVPRRAQLLQGSEEIRRKESGGRSGNCNYCARDGEGGWVAKGLGRGSWRSSPAWGGAALSPSPPFPLLLPIRGVPSALLAKGSLSPGRDLLGHTGTSPNLSGLHFQLC